MDSGDTQVSELFRNMDRVRRAWLGVTPCAALSKSQFGTLLAIFHRSRKPGAAPVTVSALAAMMGQSLPALSQRIRGLEEAGYVRRVPDPADRRVIGLALTGSGLEVLTSAQRRFGSLLSMAIEHLGPEQSEQLILLLARLAEGLELAAARAGEEEMP